MSEEWQQTLLLRCWEQTTGDGAINYQADFNRQVRYNPKSTLNTNGYDIALPPVGYIGTFNALPQTDTNPYLSPNRSSITNASPKFNWRMLIPPQGQESKIVPLIANTITGEQIDRPPVVLSLEQERMSTMEAINWKELIDKRLKIIKEAKENEDKRIKRSNIRVTTSFIINTLIFLGWRDASGRAGYKINGGKLLDTLFEYKAKYDAIRAQQGLPPLQ